MLTPGEQLVVQAAVRWHPGCSGGSAWIRSSLEAIRDYRTTFRGPEFDMVAEVAEKLWDDPQNRESTYLATKSPAGRELLRCAVHYISHQRFRLSASKADQRDFEQLPAEGTSWARAVARLAEVLYTLPPDVVELVRQAASLRGLPAPNGINLQNSANLVNAVEMMLSLEDAVNSGLWPPVSGKSLELGDARATLAMALRIARHPGSPSGKDIAFRIIAYDFNRRACDGHELELTEINIIHVPDPDSPRLEAVRHQMIDIVQQHLEGPQPEGLPGRRSDETSDAWAAGVISRFRSEPESVRVARRYSRTAATILAGIGDTISVSQIFRWLTNYPDRAADLFGSHLFDCYCYEIVPPGIRRDLLLNPICRFVDSPAPLTAARRNPVEIFRPIAGICEHCGERLIALFDVSVDPESMHGLPESRRLCLPMCPTCSEGSSGYQSRLRLDDPDDVDFWPSRDVRVGTNDLPLRRFRQISGAILNSRASAFLGGAPRWEQEPSWAICPTCRRRMIFAGQVTYPLGHPYLGFFCSECLTSNVLAQSD